MLSPGAAAVPSSACLRCQLRGVLQHLRCSPTLHRRQQPPRQAFTTFHRQQAGHDSDAEPLNKSNDGLYFKHLNIGGRIVGKPGRKQRQVSEALATKSLGERSEIVIFRDVIDSREKKTTQKKGSDDADFSEEGLKGLSLTAEEIQAAVSETAPPLEEEVNASIDALRPQAPVVEDREFDRLVKALLDGYNVQQLSRYLRRALAQRSSLTVVRQLEYRLPGTSQKKKVSFTRSRWQPGRTPIDQRRNSQMPLPRGASLTPKARTAERIVGVAWDISTESEQAQVGELEMQMTRWQLALYFDLATRDGRPKYQSQIQPPILLRKSEIRPHRRDGIVRITARRQDAEDIASQLENRTLHVGKLLLDLNNLIPEEDRKFPAAQSLRNFRAEQLEAISQRTQTVIMQQADGKIGIFGFMSSDRDNARRLLMSLMDFSSRNVRSVSLSPMEGYEDKAEGAGGPLALVPYFPDLGLHFRDRLKVFARPSLPVYRKTPKSTAADSSATLRASPTEARAEEISQSLVPMVSPRESRYEGEATAAGQAKNASYWGTAKLQSTNAWRVQFGLLLEEAAPKHLGDLSVKQDNAVDQRPNDTKIGSPKNLILRRGPSYETLLSFFKPVGRKNNHIEENTEVSSAFQKANVIRRSTLVAYFVPSPFTRRGLEATKKFPRLELTLLRTSGGKSPENEPQIQRLRGIINEEIVDIPLPDQAIDLRLTRNETIYAPIPSIVNDPEILDFVNVLNNSARAGGALRGKTEVQFTLPTWMIHDEESRRQGRTFGDIQVPYLFDRFEQMQTTLFTPNYDALDERGQHSPAVKRFLKNFPENTAIQYREVDAGFVGGRHTDLTVQPQRAPRVSPEKSRKESRENMDAETANGLRRSLFPALTIADFLTRASTGEILAWKRPVEAQTNPSPEESEDAENQLTEQSRTHPEPNEAEDGNEPAEEPRTDLKPDEVEDEGNELAKEDHINLKPDEVKDDGNEAINEPTGQK